MTRISNRRANYKKRAVAAKPSEKSKNARGLRFLPRYQKLKLSDDPYWEFSDD